MGISWIIGFAIWIISVVLWVREHIRIRKQKLNVTSNSWLFLVMMLFGLLIMEINS